MAGPRDRTSAACHVWLRSERTRLTCAPASAHRSASSETKTKCHQSARVSIPLSGRQQEGTPLKGSRCPPVPVAGRPRYRRPKELRDRRRNVAAEFPMPVETHPLRPKGRSITPKPLDLEMWNLQTREQQDGSPGSPARPQL